MSYILDALKKADQQRTLGDVPDLETAHWGERRARRSFRWIWVVAALLLVNGVLVAYLLGRDSGDVAPVVATVDNMAVEDVREDKVVPEDNQPLQPSRTITRPREPVYVPPAPVQRSRPVVQYAPAAVVSGSAEQPLTTRAIAPQQNITASSTTTPYWDDLSLEFRSSLVLPRIDVHVYDDDPARRFILVDLEKFREGESLHSGALVEQINSTSIQLNYRGTSFLMEP